MCPKFIKSRLQSICTGNRGRLYCPSLQRINSHCLAEHTNCPYYETEAYSLADVSVNIKVPVIPVDAA